MDKSLIKGGIFYSVVASLERAAPILLLPFLTRLLGVDDYGVLYTLTAIIAIISPFFLIGFNLFYQKELNFLDEDDRAEYLGTFLIQQLFFLVIGFLLLYPLFLILNKVLSIQISLIWVICVLLISYLKSIYSAFESYFRTSFKYKIFAASSLTMNILDIGLTFLIVYFFITSWSGRLLAMCSALFLVSFTLVLVLKTKGSIVFKYRKKIVSRWLEFGWPLIIHRLSGLTFNLSDRLLITGILGATATGNYTAGYQIGSLISVLSMTLNRAWTPWFYKNEKTKQYDRKGIYKHIFLIVIVIFIFYLFLLIFSELITSILLPDQFGNLFNLIAIVGLSFVFQGLYFCFVPFLVVRDKTKLLSKITLFSALLNVGINIFFLNIYGPIVAAYATLICWISQAILVIVPSIKVYEE